jgi:hypothetical protein
MMMMYRSVNGSIQIKTHTHFAKKITFASEAGRKVLLSREKRERVEYSEMLYHMCGIAMYIYIYST